MTSDARADGGAECALVDPAGQSTVMNCDKLLLCSGFHVASVCYCDGARCTASAREHTFGFGADFDGNRMNAGLSLLFGATSWFELVKK
jgi:hypothetical protein